MPDEDFTGPVQEIARAEFRNSKRLAETLEWMLNYPGIGTAPDIATQGGINPNQAGVAILTKQITKTGMYGPKAEYIVTLRALLPAEEVDPWQK